MKFGFYLPNHGATARSEPLARIAQAGDLGGFECMVVGDHIIVPKVIDSPYPYTVGGEFPGGDTGEYLEQLTLLTYLAALTENIKIVPSVMIVPYRNPVLTAKILATMDLLSEGRLILGVGVGWMEEEFEVMMSPPFKERGKVTNEYLEIFKELWTSESPSYEGEYYSFSNIHFLPKPSQKPHPKIWVGGQSKAAIRRAVNLGNGWHPVGAIPATPLEPEQITAELDYLKRYSESVGRDPNELDIAMKAPLYDASMEGLRRKFSGSNEDILEDIAEYSEIGVSHIIFDMRSTDLTQTLEKIDWFSSQIITKS
tara:strand:- start:9709 stop:10644 length:936 start_codon:yes stop_codon:yes gene_type:complete